MAETAGAQRGQATHSRSPSPSHTLSQLDTGRCPQSSPGRWQSQSRGAGDAGRPGQGGGVGTSPAGTRLSSESGFYRKAPSGGCVPTRVTCPAAPRQAGPCGCRTQDSLWRATAPHLSQERSLHPMATGPRPRPQGSALAPPTGHTRTGCTNGPIGDPPVASMGPAPGPPAHWHVLPDSLLQGRHRGPGTATLGKDWAGHRCAGRDSPSTHNTQENAKPAL